METTEIFRVQATSVKDLKDQIKALQDEIVRLKSANKDYSSEARQLQEAQRMLNETMSLTKKEATALDGSYDALVHKMAELKKQWRATNDEAERDALGKQIKGINTQLKELDASIGNFQRSVGAYGQVYDDLGKGMNNVKQVGGDLANGIMAMSSVLGLSATASDNLKDSIGSLNGVLGIFQSAKGIAGAIAGLKGFIQSLKPANKETKANTVATQANTTAQNANTTATTLGSKAIKIFGMEIKLALPIIGAITLAIGLLVKNWEKIMKLLGLQKPTVESTVKAYDKYKKGVEALNKQHEREYALMKAKGATEQEIIKLKMKHLQADIANAQVQQIILQTDLQQLIQAKAKEEDIKKATELYEEQTKKVEELGEKMKDLKNELEIAGILATAKAAKDAKTRLEKLQEEVKTLGNTVQTQAKKGRTELQKINDEHEENLKNLDKWKEKSLELAKQTKGDTAKIEKNYKDLREEFERQYKENLRNYAKATYTSAYENYQERIKLAHRDREEEFEIYGGLIADMKKTARGRNYYEEELQRQRIKTLKEERTQALAILKKLGQDIAEPDLYQSVMNATDEQFLAWYDEMLQNEKEFAKKYPEPFRTAIGKVANVIRDTKTEERKALVQFVNGLFDEADEAVEQMDPKKLQHAFETIFANPPADASPQLQAQLRKYYGMLRDTMAKSIVDDSSLSFKDKWNKLQELFNGIVPRNLRVQVWTNQIIQYSQASVNALDSVASAWQNIMNAQKENLKYQLDSGEISQQEYEDRAKAMDDRNKKSFKALKALQYSTAVINTAGAVVQALVDPAVPTYYLRAINAAAALASGVAEVAQIAGTHYQSMSSMATPNLTPTTPSVNTVGLYDFANSVAQVQEPVRAYITDSDLKIGLEHYDNVNTETTF